MFYQTLWMTYLVKKNWKSGLQTPQQLPIPFFPTLEKDIHILPLVGIPSIEFVFNHQTYVAQLCENCQQVPVIILKSLCRGNQKYHCEACKVVMEIIQKDTRNETKRNNRRDVEKQSKTSSRINVSALAMSPTGVQLQKH